MTNEWFNHNKPKAKLDAIDAQLSCASKMAADVSKILLNNNANPQSMQGKIVAAGRGFASKTATYDMHCAEVCYYGKHWLFNCDLEQANDKTLKPYKIMHDCAVKMMETDGSKNDGAAFKSTVQIVDAAKGVHSIATPFGMDEFKDFLKKRKNAPESPKTPPPKISKIETAEEQASEEQAAEEEQDPADGPVTDPVKTDPVKTDPVKTDSEEEDSDDSDDDDDF